MRVGRRKLLAVLVGGLVVAAATSALASHSGATNYFCSFGPCNGTNGKDDMIILSGNHYSANQIDSKDGDDMILDEAGDDVDRGGTHEDYVEGGAGADELHGGDGSETWFCGGTKCGLMGMNGDDDIFAGQRSDYLFGGNGSDELRGEQEDDEIWANDNTFDAVFGGGGTDNCHVDGIDAVDNCE